MAPPGRPQPIPRDARRIPVPAVALDGWLAEINDPGELKVALRIAGLVAIQAGRRGVPPSVSLAELLDDRTLRRAAGLGSEESVREALARALARGSLVAARVGAETRIWVNDERVDEYLSRAGIAALEPIDIAGFAPVSTTEEKPRERSADRGPRPNIFALYEQHIGTFGHGMAEQLRAAEEEYPARWINEAFAIASEQNVRSWGYVHAILRRWLQEGKPVPSTTAKGPQRDNRHVDGKLGHDTAPDSRTGYLESYRRRHGRLPWESDGDGDRNDA